MYLLVLNFTDFQIYFFGVSGLFLLFLHIYLTNKLFNSYKYKNINDSKTTNDDNVSVTETTPVLTLEDRTTTHLPIPEGYTSVLLGLPKDQYNVICLFNDGQEAAGTFCFLMNKWRIPLNITIHGSRTYTTEDSLKLKVIAWKFYSEDDLPINIFTFDVKAFFSTKKL